MNEKYWMQVGFNINEISNKLMAIRRYFLDLDQKLALEEHKDFICEEINDVMDMITPEYIFPDRIDQ